MAKGTVASFIVWCLLAALVIVQAAEMRSMAVECDPRQVVGPCMDAFSKGTPPSKECCDKLKEQGPCYCDYFKVPALKQFIESPNGKKIIAACSFTLPNCS